MWRVPAIESPVGGCRDNKSPTIGVYIRASFFCVAHCGRPPGLRSMYPSAPNFDVCFEVPMKRRSFPKLSVSGNVVISCRKQCLHSGRFNSQASVRQ